MFCLIAICMWSDADIFFYKYFLNITNILWPDTIFIIGWLFLTHLTQSVVWSIAVTCHSSSSIVTFLQKNLLLWNHWTKRNHVQLEWSLGGLHSKLCQTALPSIPGGCCYKKIEISLIISWLLLYFIYFKTNLYVFFFYWIHFCIIAQICWSSYCFKDMRGPLGTNVQFLKCLIIMGGFFPPIFLWISFLHFSNRFYQVMTLAGQ